MKIINEELDKVLVNLEKERSEWGAGSLRITVDSIKLSDGSEIRLQIGVLEQDPIEPKDE